MAIKKQAKNISKTALITFDNFFNQFPSRLFKKRSAILNAGSEENDVYYLKKGFARAYAVSSEGEELTMIIFQPGDFFPLISTVKPQKLNYYIEALTEVEIISVPRSRFIEFLQSREDLLTELILHLTARFEGVLTRMEYLVFGTAAQKLASIIVILGDRFGEKRGTKIYIKAPLTHKDLASLVGITRETTTLILKEFSKRRFITFQKRHLIIDNPKALQSNSLVEI
jgi:CRP/FNR family transcriptional regulator, cyclic AMP receptor protein